MVRIRLRRQGAKNQPSYRIVVIDQRKPRDGKYIENIGHYNPRTHPSSELVKEGRALYWLSVGAQPSDAVRRIFVHSGTWERFQRLCNGEALEDLLREAEANKLELPSQKTSRRFEDSEPQKPTIEADKEAPEPDTPAPADDDKTAEVDPDPISVADEPSQPDESETKEPLPDAPENTDGLYGDLNRHGKTELTEDPYPPDPVPDPTLRASRTHEDIREARRNEPAVEERHRQVLTKRWDGKDSDTRNFLKFQYNGKCQICGDVFAKLDGEPYFEALYIETYTTANWLDRPANTLCLCPNHFARFKHGSRVFEPDYRKQILAYAGPGVYEISLELCGKQERIRFSERHIIDLKALVEETAGSAAR